MMKVSLVIAQGNSEGKVIPITMSQFVIGRDPQCHLRPASNLVSKKHCAVVVEPTRVILRDFNSTNGTFLNGEGVKGDNELHSGDQIRVGPLKFKINIESSVPVNKTTPLPKQKDDALSDEAIANLLLDMQDEEIPTGNTTTEVDVSELLRADQERQHAKVQRQEEGSGNTRQAAEDILQKYARRNRK
ncbi:MAG: FHA domain-containing protein [Gemmataceae bacterium]